MDVIRGLTILTEEQKVTLLQKIHDTRVGLLKPSGRTSFGKAVRWTLYIFAFSVLNNGPGAPPTGYGASFQGFADYVFRKNAELAAEETEEAIEDG